MKMIISTSLPFYFVKNPFFTEYAQFLNPGCIPTTQNTGRGFLINDYDDLKLLEYPQSGSNVAILFLDVLRSLLLMKEFLILRCIIF